MPSRQVAGMGLPPTATDMTLAQFYSAKFLVFYVFLLSSLYIHFRGQVKIKLRRHLGNHATLLAPYNVLMYWFSKVPAKPLIEVNTFPELAQLRDNWQVIREEALNLYNEGHIRAATGQNDVGFNSFFKHGWKRFYVKWYGEPLPSALQQCPRTVALIESIPSVHAAMFTMLPPGGKLNPHRDPFAGSLRYHLGLATPNSDDCRIFVDGIPYAWRDGEDVVFDETYIHWVENKTDQARLILFCDVERPLKSRFMRAFNHLFSTTVIRASATQNVETEHVGGINRFYAATGHASSWMKQLKKKSKLAYRLVQAAIVAVLFYWLLFI
jgi:beta-hydroxylase